MRARMALALLLLAALPLVGQKAPENELGFQPGKLYDFSEIDTVNLYNGNLMLSVPIGSRKQVSPTLSYQIQLVYNSKVWDYETYDGCDAGSVQCSDVLPNRRSNAGLGWRVSLGRLLPPSDPTAPPTNFSRLAFVYESPAGDEHGFYGNGGNVQLAMDASALRLIRIQDDDVAKIYEVEFPSGETHRFEWENSAYRLKKISDRFESVVQFAYEYDQDDNRRVHKQTIIDSTQTSHVIQYSVDTDLNESVDRGAVVDFIDYMGVGGESVRYDFQYTTMSVKGWIGDGRLSLPMLTTLVQPDGSTFQFDYYTDPLGDGEEAVLGAMATMHFPTGGEVEYHYQGYTLPGKHTCSQMATEFGIKSRTISDGNPLTKRTWDYLPAHGNFASVEFPVPANYCCETGSTMGSVSFAYPIYWTRTSVLSPREDGVGGVQTRSRSDHYFDGYSFDFSFELNSCPPIVPFDPPSPGDPWAYVGRIAFGYPGTVAAPAPDVRKGVTTSIGLADEYSVDNDGRRLTTEVYSGCAAFTDVYGQNADCTNGKLERSTYTAYEGHPLSISRSPYPGYGDVYGDDVSMQLKSSKTVYHEADDAGCSGDCYVASDNSENNGTGIYGKVVRSSNFPGAQTKTSITKYTQWTLADAFTKEKPWITGLFTERSVNEGTEIRRELTCFDDQTGFLERRRVLRNSDHPGASDLLTIYEPSDFGDIFIVKNFGGEKQATLPESHNCESSVELLGTPWYQVETHYFTPVDGTSTEFYTGGIPVWSRYYDRESGAPLGFKTIDRTIDPYTGAVLATRDSAGVTTTYGYEATPARLESVAPTGGAMSSYEYVNATSSKNAHVIETVTGSTGTIATNTYEFDGLGRVKRVSNTLPNGKVAVTQTNYDRLGRIGSVTQPIEKLQHPFSDVAGDETSFKYDVFDRPMSIRSADGATTTFDYLGVRRKTRTTMVATSLNGSSPATVTELYDEDGRVQSVEEESGPGGARVATTYTYDINGSLTSANTTSGDVTQTRTFIYDTLGFLDKEAHPETQDPETSGIDYTDYDDYDARGHAWKRTLGGTTVNFTFDSAERLTELSGPTGSVKEFKFGTTDLVDNGKLIKAIRHNKLTSAGNVDVTETYDYSASGQVSTRTTLVERVTAVNGIETRTPIQQFDYGVTYDEHLMPRTIRMPSCTLYGCTVVDGLESVTNERTAGYLTAVDDFATMSYHPSGMVASVRHETPKAPTDIYDALFGMPRPSKITFEGDVTPPPCATPAPSIHAPDSVCPSVLTTASVDVEQGATYAWTITGATREPGSPSNTNTFTFQPNSSGPVHLSVTVTNACGTAIGTASHDIAVKSAPVQQAISAPLTVCANGTEHGASVVPMPGETYTWAIEGGTIVSSNGAVMTFKVPSGPPTPPTTVKMFVTATNSCGISQQFYRSVGVNQACVTLAPCVAKWNSELLDRTLTVNPLETTPLAAGLAFDPPDPIPPGMVLPTAFRYAFKWYVNDELVQTTDPAAPSSTYVLQFTGQSYVRVEGTLTCKYEAQNVEATAEKLVDQTYGIMSGYCPTPEVSVESTSVELTGVSVTLSAKTPYPGATYKWYQWESGNTREEITVGGATPSLVVTTPGTYWLRVSTDCGKYNDTPTIVVHTAQCAPVRITGDPQGATVTAGATVPLSVYATASPAPTSVLWSRDSDTEHDVPVDGSSLKTTITTPPVLKTTDFSARVGNGCSVARSRFARVHVTACADIPIASQPQDVSIGKDPNDTAELRVTATASGLRYQWYIGESGDTSAPVEGATASTLILKRGNGVADQYWVRMSFADENRCAVDSRTVNVCRDPAVYDPIGNYSNDQPMLRRDIRIGVDGTNLTYAWYEGTELGASHALGSTFDTARVWPAVTTDYWVRVTSACASPLAARSITAAARVSVAPVIRSGPSSGWITAGASRVLSVDADGTFLTYQWYRRNGASEELIQDATAASYNAQSITVDSIFFCRVKSGDADTDSADAVLTVCRPPAIGVVGTPNGRSGSDVTLQIVDPESNATYEWYQGENGDTSNPVGPGTTRVVKPLITTKYWARLIRVGCTANSAALTVTVCYPAITAQPQDKSIVRGSQATLTVSATGTPALSYQWFQGAAGDTSTSVGTSSSYTTPTSLATTTSYWVRISSPLSSCSSSQTDSGIATVTVCNPAAVTLQPVSGIAAPGGTQLRVEATGTAIAYQWYAGARGNVSSPLGGPQGPTIVVNPALTTQYWVRVSASCGTPADSNAATVYVRPSINIAPVGGPVTKGTTKLLTVAANGVSLAYQWYQRSGATASVMSGATNSSFTTPQILVDSAFFCRVSSGIPEAFTDSADAVLTVCQARAIRIVGYPSQCSGSEVTLAIVDPDANETYEWYQGASGNTAVPVGTGATLRIWPLGTADYWARTKRPSCDADSAALKVRVCYPNITEQPQDGSIVAGDEWTLRVAATGTTPLSYQWYQGAVGDTTVPVGTSSTYVTPTTLTTTTSYWARVSSPLDTCSSSSVNSDAATVVVCQPPTITDQPDSNSYVKNAAFTLSVTATGTGPLQYQWYEGASGVTTKPIGNGGSSINLYATATKSYWVRVTGSCGMINSATALVSVLPVITQQPVNTTVCGFGSQASFSVTATGADSYTWYRKVGSNYQLVSSGSSSLPIAITTSPETFVVDVASGNAIVRSNPASATVTPKPTLNGFTATQNGSQYTLAANVLTSERPSVGYRFYQGALGNTSNLIVDSTQSYKSVTPPYKPITYWVRLYFLNNPTSCFSDAALTIQ